MTDLFIAARLRDVLSEALLAHRTFPNDPPLPRKTRDKLQEHLAAVLTTLFASLLEEREREIREALVDLLKLYLRLASSGDCGHWNPEDDAEVIKARAALRLASSLSPGAQEQK